MLNDRLAAAHSVRDAYLPLKRDTDLLAQRASECILEMQRARADAGLPLGTGAAPIADIARGAALLYEAQRCFAEAHPKLAALIGEAGLGRFYGYGDDECPPDAKFAALPRAIAAAA
ncbi:hypothetical protein [Sphingomonas sp. RIT328]|uniref:hypothetical protein n=1 Tax=Sphingomonas sp. RIT328 TaxID=1470591 RepID=UPI00044D3FFA|nr:hypothetical protein [Sphingomonas sp. RIT328]EZP49958.1 hypothetical protein BW41_03283 [Sphingomonas sp. RIT328]